MQLKIYRLIAAYRVDYAEIRTVYFYICGIAGSLTLRNLDKLRKGTGEFRRERIIHALRAIAEREKNIALYYRAAADRLNIAYLIVHALRQERRGLRLSLREAELLGEGKGLFRHGENRRYAAMRVFFMYDAGRFTYIR